MAGDTSVASSVTRDNLFGTNYPIKYDADGVTIAASQTLARGCVLGKIKYAAGTATADAGNTGDGVLSAFALAAGGPPAVGDYTLTCVEAVTNSGVFELTNASSVVVGRVTVPVSGNVTAIIDGITFNLADGATDFVVGDFFTLPVNAGSGQAKALDHTAVDGSGEFFGVLTQAVTTAAATTQVAPVAIAGSFQVQALTFGGSTTAADVEADARDNNCYFETSYSGNNVVGG